MATIFLRVKAPNTGIFFVGNVILREEAWTPVEVAGLSLYMRSTIISALQGGFIKADKPVSLIIAELSTSMTRREIEFAVSDIGISKCCCIRESLMQRPVISSHVNNQIDVPLQFALTTHPYQPEVVYNDIHTSTDWEICTDADYTNVVWSSYDDEINKEYIVVLTGIQYDGVYYLRAKFKSKLFYSQWSHSVVIHALNTP